MLFKVYKFTNRKIGELPLKIKIKPHLFHL